MKNSVWKLSALAGVVILGFLVVLQTQFGLTRPADELQAGQKNGGEPAKTLEKDDEDRLPSSHLGLAGQSEPGAEFPPAERDGDPGKSPATTIVHRADDPPESPFGGSPDRPNSESPPGDDGNPFSAAPKKTADANPPESTPPTDGPSFGRLPETTNDDAIRPAAIAKTATPSNPDVETGAEPPGAAGNTPFGSDPVDSTSDGGANPEKPGVAAHPASDSGDANPFGPANAKPATANEPTPAAANPFGGQPGADAAENPPEPASTETPAASPFSEESGQPPSGSSSGEPAENGPSFRSDEKRDASAEKKPEPPPVSLFAGEKPKPERKPEPEPEIKPEPEPASAETNQPEPLDANARPEAKPEPEPEPPPAESPTPKRLSPAPEAARLKPAKPGREPEPLSGAGTLRRNAPQGRQRAQLTIEKIAPKSASMGKPFIYDIVIKNVGTSTATQVVVDDQIPKGTKLTGTAPQAVLVNKKLRWELGTLKPGEQQKISVRVVPTAPGKIGSIATVNFVSEVAAATQIQAPTLDFQFTGPKQAKVGEAVSFRFVVTNKGTETAKDVWIRDVIPDGLQHPAGKDLEYEVGALKPGESKTVDLKMKAARPGTATNRGIVTAKGGVRVESKVVVEIVAPRLVISRTGPKRRFVGAAAVYTNMVTNDSPKTVEGAKLTEVIPAGMEFVEATGGGQYDPARRMVAWEIGPLEPKQSRAFRVRLLPKTTGKQRSLVRAYTPNGGVVQAGSETAINGYPRLGLDVASLDRPVTVGERITLRVLARNRGTKAASNVRIRVTLPEELKLVAVRGSGKYSQKGRAVHFSDLPSVKAGGKAEYEIVARAAAAGDVRVKVQIQSKDMQRPLNREEAVRIISANR